MPGISSDTRLLFAIVAAAAGVLAGVIGNVLSINIVYFFTRRGRPPTRRPTYIWMIFFLSAIASVTLGALAGFTPSLPPAATSAFISPSEIPTSALLPPTFTETAPNPTPVALEGIPQTVFAFSSGDNNPAIGANAAYYVSYDSNKVATYTWTFDLPNIRDDSIGAGLEFQFNDVVDISNCEWVVFTIQFCQENESIKLFLIDDRQHKAYFPVASEQLNPIEKSIRLDQFLDAEPDLRVNLHELRAISLYTDSSENSGHHEVAISDIRFVRRLGD